MGTEPVIWLVAAGTGGHIFPGISVADEIRSRYPNSHILFLGSRDRLESQLIPRAGYELVTVSASPWKGRGWWGKLNSLLQLLKGFGEALNLTREKGCPDVFVSVGGYISVPIALALWIRRVPIVLIEPNIRAGLANRVLSWVARRAYTTPGSDALRKLHCPVEDAGNPVRNNLRPLEVRPQVSRVLVLGGSQGAQQLSLAALQAFDRIARDVVDVELVLQSGAAHFEKIQAQARSLQSTSRIEVVPFIDNMADLLARSDVVLARAGAMTLAELSLVGSPCVLVPYPYAADDHQRVNAQLLESGGAAWLVDERDAGAQLDSRLEEKLRLLMGADGLAVRKGLSDHLKSWGRPRAAAVIAEGILQAASDES